MDTLSNAQQIKALYREVLADQEEHSRIELFDYARRNSANRYTDGMLTGALRTLITDTDDYICVRRGWYKKKDGEDRAQEPNSLVEAYAEVFRETLKKCGNIKSDPFRVLRLGQDERSRLADIENCIAVISETVERLMR